MTKGPHATHREVESLLHGALSAPKRHTLIRHLLRSCCSCVEALSTALPPRGDEAPFSDEQYEFAVRRAGRWLKLHSGELRDLYGHAAREFCGEVEPLCCEAPELSTARAKVWLEAARSVQHQSPEESLVAAGAAAAFSANASCDLDLQTSDGSASAAWAESVTLEGECWLEVANAHRIVGDLPAAERAIRIAAMKHRQGGSDLLQALELAYYGATIFKSSRNFPEAERLFARTFEGYLDLGLNHLAGRSLIARGLLFAQQKQPDVASEIILDGLELIEPEREPSLALAAYHALIKLRAEAGSLEVASHLLRRARPLYDLWGGELDLLKYRWVEAEIQLGLGDLDAAERGFSEVRAAFQARELPFQAALVTLDLCLVWLQLGKTEPLKAAAEEMLATFAALKIRPEALATVRLFAEAAKQEQASTELLRRLTAAVHENAGRGH